MVAILRRAATPCPDADQQDRRGDCGGDGRGLL